MTSESASAHLRYVLEQNTEKVRKPQSPVLVLGAHSCSAENEDPISKRDGVSAILLVSSFIACAVRLMPNFSASSQECFETIQ